MKLNEVIKKAEAKGICTKRELSLALFPATSNSSRNMNMSNLCTGKTKGIKEEWIKTICEMCECSADELFDI